MRVACGAIDAVERPLEGVQEADAAAELRSAVAGPFVGPRSTAAALDLNAVAPRSCGFAAPPAAGAAGRVEEGVTGAAPARATKKMANQDGSRVAATVVGAIRW